MIETLAGLALARANVDILAQQKGDIIDSVGTSGKPHLSLIDAMGGGMTSAGIRVTPESAMQSSAVNACVRVYAESVGSVPLIVYRRDKERKDRFPKHPLYSILHDQPNAWMSAFEWRELMERHRCLRGNAYSLIERNGRGDVTALYPLRPDRVQVIKGDDLLPYYRVSEMAGAPVLPYTQIFHLRNSTNDSYRGLGYIEEAMEAVGLTLALERFGSSLFGNGAMMRGFFKYGGTIKHDDWPKLREMFRETYVGLQKSNSPGLLDGQWDWVSTSMKAEEAQFLESRNYQVEDIARLFRMPTLMIGHADKTSTYASAEQFFLAFVVHTLTPVLTRWEQALKRSLFTDIEGSVYPEFLTMGLLRGDIKSRYAAYAVARQWGWLNADEIRGFENMNPLPDGQGEAYLEPLNMIPAGSDRGAIEDPGTKMLDSLREVIRMTAKELDTTEVHDDA